MVLKRPPRKMRKRERARLTELWIQLMLDLRAIQRPPLEWEITTPRGPLRVALWPEMPSATGYWPGMERWSHHDAIRPAPLVFAALATSLAAELSRSPPDFLAELGLTSLAKSG